MPQDAAGRPVAFRPSRPAEPFDFARALAGSRAREDSRFLFEVRLQGGNGGGLWQCLDATPPLSLREPLGTWTKRDAGLPSRYSIVMPNGPALVIDPTGRTSPRPLY